MPLKRVRDYTLAIAKGTQKRKQTEPKIWFTSIKSFASVLSAMKPVAVARSVNLTLDIGLGDACAVGRVTRRRTEHIVA